MYLQDELEAALWDMLAAFANTFMTSEHLSSSSLDVRIDAVLLAADSLLAARWRDDNGLNSRSHKNICFWFTWYNVLTHALDANRHGIKRFALLILDAKPLFDRIVPAIT